MKTLLVALLCLPLAVFAADAPKDYEKIQFKGIQAKPLVAGSPTTPEELKGKVVVIDFWATWCGPCKVAIPHYEVLHQKYKDKGVVFLGINEDENDKARDNFIKTNKISFPMYQDTAQSFAKTFNVVALPSLFVLDKDHKVVALFRGFDKSKPEALEKLLQKLIKK